MIEVQAQGGLRHRITGARQVSLFDSFASSVPVPLGPFEAYRRIKHVNTNDKGQKHREVIHSEGRPIESDRQGSQELHTHTHSALTISSCFPPLGYGNLARHVICFRLLICSSFHSSRQAAGSCKKDLCQSGSGHHGISIDRDRAESQ